MRPARVASHKQASDYVATISEKAFSPDHNFPVIHQQSGAKNRPSTDMPCCVHASDIT